MEFLNTYKLILKQGDCSGIDCNDCPFVTRCHEYHSTCNVCIIMSKISEIYSEPPDDEIEMFNSILIGFTKKEIRKIKLEKILNANIN